MRTAWKRLWNLTGRERHDFLLGLMLLPLAEMSLRIFGLRRLQRRAESWNRHLDGADSQIDPAKFCESRAAARMIDAASRHGLTRGNCLSQSVVLWWLLRRRRLPVQLRIGAKKERGNFEAHAWVELDGKAINDADDIRKQYALFEGRVTSGMAGQR